MLQTRIVTAAVALPLVLSVLFFAPAWGFALFTFAVTGWSVYEVVAMMGAGGGTTTAAIVSAVAGACWTVTSAASSGAAPALMVVLAMALLATWVAVEGAALSIPRGIIALLGGLYVGMLFPFFALVRALPNGARCLALMLCVVVASDSGAYFVGRSFGRMRLAPKVSPGKTVEGALGSAASGLIAAVLLANPLGLAWGVGTTIGYGLMVNLLAQAGDLAESAFKRVVGVKDSGWLFPGHGGLLDRTDSLVFAAVFSYYYIR